MGMDSGVAYDNACKATRAAQVDGKPCVSDPRTAEQVMVDMIREDLGVIIEPQAWRMFIRHRFGRLSPLAHRIHDGKR